MMKSNKIQRRTKIKRRIRAKLVGTAERPRLYVYKSNQRIYAQLVNDDLGHTLLAACSAALGGRNVNIDKAKKVGEMLGEKAVEKGFSTVLFDRSGYPYHGKVKALAEGAREKGLKF